MRHAVGGAHERGGNHALPVRMTVPASLKFMPRNAQERDLRGSSACL